MLFCFTTSIEGLSSYLGGPSVFLQAPLIQGMTVGESLLAYLLLLGMTWGSLYLFRQNDKAFLLKVPVVAPVQPQVQELAPDDPGEVQENELIETTMLTEWGTVPGIKAAWEETIKIVK